MRSERPLSRRPRSTCPEYLLCSEKDLTDSDDNTIIIQGASTDNGDRVIFYNFLLKTAGEEGLLIYFLADAQRPS